GALDELGSVLGALEEVGPPDGLDGPLLGALDDVAVSPPAKEALPPTLEAQPAPSSAIAATATATSALRECRPCIPMGYQSAWSRLSVLP
ncbi:MAG: hypothetical protein ACR2F6_01120, partial [Mycobacteriales bacterium]